MSSAHADLLKRYNAVQTKHSAARQAGTRLRGCVSAPCACLHASLTTRVCGCVLTLGAAQLGVVAASFSPLAPGLGLALALAARVAAQVEAHAPRLV